MPSHPIVRLADDAKRQMLQNVKPGEIPGRIHSTLSDDDIAVGAFSAADGRRAAAEHGKTCDDPNCHSHETLARASVRVMAVTVVPIFGPRPIERLLAPEEARRMAGSLWAAADLAEGS